ncbi:sensor histidine kinase [Duganella vulcania]|nr:hybrid sensor histidine kinase/response regulator [Duganella vulcania]
MWQKVMGRFGVRWMLWSIALLLVAGGWTLTLHQLDESKRLQIDDARRDAQALGRLFNEHAARTLEAADQAVIFLRHRYEVEGARLDIKRELQDGLGPADIFNQFSIVDEHGDVTLSSIPFKSTNVADREHIRVHMNSDEGLLYISKPILGRVSNKWSLQLTRRVNYPDGRFRGVVVASMDPQYFTRLYQDIDVGRQGLIALVGADGVMRVRRVGKDSSLGQDISASPLFAAMRAQRQGTTSDAGPVDGRDRMYAFQRLERFPLYVLVGIDLRECMARYDASRQRTLALAAGATTVILLCTLGLHILFGQLIRSSARAVAANLAKSRFLANMSHELRTPLNGILGYSELLQIEMGASRAGGFADAIHRSGLRLLGLVEAVLELSALESGREPLVVEPMVMADLPQLALSRHREAAVLKGLALSAQMEAGLPAVWPCDRVKLLRILDILLLNAISATAAGSVLLRVAPGPGGGLRCEVRDTGPGVPEAMRRAIFENFSQADDTASRAKEGAGLGLAIASQLAALMRGRLRLRRSDSGGAVFVVELPAQRLEPDGGGQLEAA